MTPNCLKICESWKTMKERGDLRDLGVFKFLNKNALYVHNYERYIKKTGFCLLGMRTKRPEFQIDDTLLPSIQAPHYFQPGDQADGPITSVSFELRQLVLM